MSAATNYLTIGGFAEFVGLLGQKGRFAGFLVCCAGVGQKHLKMQQIASRSLDGGLYRGNDS